MRALGLNLDSHITPDARFQALMSRAQLRRGILVRAARISWELDTSALRVIRGAIITSSLRYGLVALGPRIPDDLLNKIDSRVVNVAARRISGVPYITRIEVRNLFRSIVDISCILFF